jgi:transcriptional regulator GlxA family with amidase domain
MRTRSLGILLIPGFSLMAYASAIEPLRAANTLAARPLYRWANVSLDGRPTAASNGAIVHADLSIGGKSSFETLLICCGGDSTLFKHQPTLRWLRALARKGLTIGGVSGGSAYILARAGLLDSRRFTIHWEHLPSLVEEFPQLRSSRTLFEFDRDRLTCSGGAAALDMMHALIAADHGWAFAASVSDWLLHTDIRPGNRSQRMTMRERFGIEDPKLLAVLQAMEANLESPLSRSKLSATAGVSVRQLERLFHRHLGCTIGEHYLAIRLDRSQILLRQSHLPIMEIVVACGFVSTSHFSRVYKQRFACSPSAERRSAIMRYPSEFRRL